MARPELNSELRDGQLYLRKQVPLTSIASKKQI